MPKMVTAKAGSDEVSAVEYLQMDVRLCMPVVAVANIVVVVRAGRVDGQCGTTVVVTVVSIFRT